MIGECISPWGRGILPARDAWPGKACAHADVLQRSGIIEEAKQQRADVALADLVPAETGDDAVTVTLVLDLEHHSLIRLIGSVHMFGDDAIESGSLEAAKPIRGYSRVVGCGGDVDRRRRRIRTRSNCFRRT